MPAARKSRGLGKTGALCLNSLTMIQYEINSPRIVCGVRRKDRTMKKKPVALFFLAFTAATAAQASPFPGAYTNVAEHQGHWYAWTLDHGSWQNCQVEAQSLGWHLATINDAVENDWLDDFILGSYRRDQGSSNSGAWIGLHRDDQVWVNPEDGWKWVNGESLAYENYSDLVGIEGTHMYLHGSDHDSRPGEWNCNPVHDTEWDLHFRGIIETPEPATLSMLGLGCLVLIRRRKRTCRARCVPWNSKGDGLC